jgi:hypothetical protein
MAASSAARFELEEASLLRPGLMAGARFCMAETTAMRADRVFVWD